jgi:hypothetical protein
MHGIRFALGWFVTLLSCTFINAAFSIMGQIAEGVSFLILLVYLICRLEQLERIYIYCRKLDRIKYVL